MKRRSFITASILAGTATALHAKAFAPKDDPQKPFIVKAGKSRFDSEDAISGLKISSKDTNREFSMFEEIADDGPNAGPPLHVHHKQDEIFYIVEGKFIFQVGDERIYASAWRYNLWTPGDTSLLLSTKPKDSHDFFLQSMKG